MRVYVIIFSELFAYDRNGKWKSMLSVQNERDKFKLLHVYNKKTINIIILYVETRYYN